MPRTRLFLSALLIAALAEPATAAPDWSRPARVEVELDNFSYRPKTIRLRAGQPVLLRLVNSSSSGHDFTAPRFFAAATVRPQDQATIGRGSIEVRGKGSREVMLVPRAGRYPLKCGHAFHKMFGMSGTIVVE